MTRTKKRKPSQGPKGTEGRELKKQKLQEKEEIESTIEIIPEIKEIEKLSQIQINKQAPDFHKDAVLNGNFKKIQLSDFKGKYLLLFFYPLDFTFNISNF
jgi:DNA-directed RNA polymerase delta subunit